MVGLACLVLAILNQRVFSLVAAIVAVVLAVYEYFHLFGSTFGLISPGVGFYVLLIGAIVALVGAIVSLKKNK